MMRMDDEFGISNKAGDVSKEGDSRKSDDGGGGGTTIESNLFPKKKMMMMVHDHDHHNCPFTSEDNGWRGGGGGDVVGGGPTCNNDSRPKTTSSSGDVIGGGVSAAAAVKILQPFDIGAAVPQTSFKSPGEFMAAPSMGFPFTNAQWKELERQAMIYKYMMASLPVPPQLLFPFLRNPSLPSSPPLVGGGLNLIRFSNGGDLEPGRCRRTDGKKWRCSRDVAPDQKYCERHLHRGRHRSRKPVELPPKNSNNKKTRLESNPPPPSTLQFPSNNTKVTQLCNYVKSTEKVSAFESLERQRCLDWMMKGEQWQGGSVYDQNSNGYANFNSGKDSVFINQDLVVSLENQNQTETPIRGFIDAWSHHHHHNNTSSGNSPSNGNLSLSPLSLSMGGSSSSNTTTPIDDEMGWVQMGLGVIQTGHQDREYSTKLPFSNWLPPASWTPSTPGGPLAEVLRPSTVIPSNPPSPAAINGDSNSPQATTLSSPSGVLQKTLAASSWSDSSGSSSPTLASSNANKKPVELALLWLNQGKLASST